MVIVSETVSKTKIVTVRDRTVTERKTETETVTLRKKVTKNVTDGVRWTVIVRVPRTMT